jgi:DNA-directed RNA polymerase specialized sigma24 family protein
MQRVTGGASKRRFEAFAAGAADTLFRTGCLMTGDASEAEDLVQETLIKVARRWHRVAAMDHPVAYARRILINLALCAAARQGRPATRPRHRRQTALRFRAHQDRCERAAILTSYDMSREAP